MQSSLTVRYTVDSNFGRDFHVCRNQPSLVGSRMIVEWSAVAKDNCDVVMLSVLLAVCRVRKVSVLCMYVVVIS